MTQYPQYVLIDARKVAEFFKEKCLPKVDLIITSPPYFDVKSYGDVDNQIGHKQSYENYLDDVAGVLQQCHDLANANATMWLIADIVRRNGTAHPIPFDIMNRLQSSSSARKPGGTWHLRDIIVWNRTKNLPWHATGRSKHEFEYVLFFSKTNDFKYYVDRVREIPSYQKWWLTYPERYNPRGKPPSNVWEFSIPIRGWGNSYQNHVCPFPFPLVERILTMCSDENDLVLDPFAGSGTVLALADKMNRRAIGADINPDYRKKYENEVLIGAQKYWAARQLELVKLQERARLFWETNLRLRKLKIAFKIASQVRKAAANSDFALVLLDSKEHDNQVELIILSQRGNADIEIQGVLRQKQSLSREYKVEAAIRCGNYEPMLSQLPPLLYAYSGKRIYRYARIVPAADIFLDIGRSQCVYSNIRLEANAAMFG